MAKDRERPQRPASSAVVGYGRPPEAHRFKPKGVGNPWGRRGKPKPRIDFLDEVVTVPVGGKPQRMTRDETIDLALYREMMAGNVSAGKELDRRRKERLARRPTAASDEGLSPEDQAAFDRLIERRARGLRVPEAPPEGDETDDASWEDDASRDDVDEDDQGGAA